MNLAKVESIISAVLYEGYVLYPYRPSSVKNRQRWTFGGIYPQQYSEAQRGLEPYKMQTECLVAGDASTTLEAKVRFLHILDREVRESLRPGTDAPQNLEAETRTAEALWVEDKLYQTWQEATEREAVSSELTLGELLAEPKETTFAFPHSREIEVLKATDGEVRGVIVRQQQALTGTVAMSAEQAAEGLFKVAVVITNVTPWASQSAPDSADDGRNARDGALIRAFASTHTVLGVEGGSFVSLLDPPDRFREIAASCANIGTWPVLVGQEGETDMMLSSPIILYDYPQVAPESHGDLFDGTEIDEILTLRIMTLTEDEKAEMRAVDERARALLERTESLTGEQMMNLHGTIRSLMVRGGSEDG